MTTSFLENRHSSSHPSTTNNLRKRSGMDSKQPLLPSTVPSYTIPTNDNDDNHTPHKSGNVRRFTWGMFEVAYGAPMRHISLKSLRKNLRELRRSAPWAARLFVEIYRTARTPVTVHLLAVILLIIAPAFSLYLSAAVLSIVRLVLSEPPHL
jgi:hypothetical protein